MRLLHHLSVASRGSPVGTAPLIESTEPDAVGGWKRLRQPARPLSRRQSFSRRLLQQAAIEIQGRADYRLFRESIGNHLSSISAHGLSQPGIFKQILNRLRKASDVLGLNVHTSAAFRPLRNRR